MLKREAKQAERLASIVRAAEAIRIPERPDAWAKLAGLADRADYNGSRIPPDGIILNGDRFQGILNISVLLRYDPPGEEPFTDSWTFPAEFAGRFRNGEVVIDTIDVDTRSFFAGEEFADAEQ